MCEQTKKRYIDVEPVIHKYEEAIKELWNECHAPASWSDAYDCVIEDLADAPTVDVKEVVYGTWRLETDEECPDPMSKLVICSNCSEAANSSYKFCPNCGATMTKLTTEGAKFECT